MRFKSLLLFFSATLVLFSCQPENSANEKFRVSYVIDGDTFIFINERGEKEKLRLIGINAPECKHPEIGKEEFCEESTKALNNLVLNKMVELKFDLESYDRYGRTLAYVYVDDSIFVNEQMVLNGYAYSSSYSPNLKHQIKLNKAEKEAKRRKSGLWGDDLDNDGLKDRPDVILNSM